MIQRFYLRGLYLIELNKKLNKIEKSNEINIESNDLIYKLIKLL